MHGNVCEWCADDWHNNFLGAPNDGSAWLEHDLLYLAKNRHNNLMSVLMGGSWTYSPYYFRSACRDDIISRVIHDNYIGFRIVCVFGKNL